MGSRLSPSEDNILRAARALQAGELVVLPTETVYGLAADASQAQAVQAIYTLKGRPPGHPLIVHVASKASAQRWGVFDARAHAFASASWPGPLTLILPRQPDAPAWACGGQDSIGLRCPSHPVAQAVLQAFAKLDALGGVAAPSANRFGRVSPTRAQHVLDDLGEQTPLLLDGGPSEVGVESTIVDLTTPKARLLRPGRIRREAIEAVLGGPLGGQEADAPKASGTLASHYCPVTPVSVVDEDELDAALIQLRAQSDGLGAVSFAASSAAATAVSGQAGRMGVYARQRPANPEVLWLAAPSDADGWEQTLYDAMRQLDRQQLARIVIAAPREGPQWDAVMDRVSRAAVRA